MAAKKSAKKKPAPKKAAKSKPKTSGPSHKSPEAAKARASVDKKVAKLLGLKKYKDGAKKLEIAQAIGEDATAVKASLNRGVRDGSILTEGTTMNTLYRLAAAKPSKSAKEEAPAEEEEDEEDEEEDEEETDDE